MRKESKTVNQLQVLKHKLQVLKNPQKSAFNFSKNKLGFYLLTPDFGQPGNNYNTIGFAYRLVITPKPGLFPIKE